MIQVQLIPEQASTFAQEIDLFYIGLWLLTIVFTIGIALAAAYFMHKYKRKSDGEIPEQIEGAREKIDLIEERIAQLQTMADALRTLVKVCEHGARGMPCPIIRMALDDSV